jgi:hypothetical protein
MHWPLYALASAVLEIVLEKRWLGRVWRRAHACYAAADEHIHIG